MKFNVITKLLLFFILITFFFSCVSQSTSNNYGLKGDYEEGKHPGLDYLLPMGTPILACADGRVVIYEPNCGDGGSCIHIDHGDVWSIYEHLSKALVNTGDYVKRGEVIGLSGISRSRQYTHLGFGIFKEHGNRTSFSDSYDPNTMGVNGNKPEYYDPNKDYSSYQNIDKKSSTSNQTKSLSQLLEELEKPKSYENLPILTSPIPSDEYVEILKSKIE